MKRQRQIEIKMTTANFSLTRCNGKHCIWNHNVYKQARVVTSRTPSDCRTMKNIERDINEQLRLYAVRS